MRLQTHRRIGTNAAQTIQTTKKKSMLTRLIEKRHFSSSPCLSGSRSVLERRRARHYAPRTVIRKANRLLCFKSTIRPRSVSRLAIREMPRALSLSSPSARLLEKTKGVSPLDEQSTSFSPLNCISDLALPTDDKFTDNPFVPSRAMRPSLVQQNMPRMLTIVRYRKATYVGLTGSFTRVYVHVSCQPVIHGGYRANWF